MHLWCDVLLVPAEVRLQGWGPVDLVVALAHDTPVFPVQVLVTAPARVHRRGLSRKTNFLIGLISFFHLILYPKHSRTTYRSASSSPAFTCHRKARWATLPSQWRPIVIATSSRCSPSSTSASTLPPPPFSRLLHPQLLLSSRPSMHGSPMRATPHRTPSHLASPASSYSAGRHTPSVTVSR